MSDPSSEELSRAAAVRYHAFTPPERAQYGQLAATNRQLGRLLFDPFNNPGMWFPRLLAARSHVAILEAQQDDEGSETAEEVRVVRRKRASAARFCGSCSTICICAPKRSRLQAAWAASQRPAEEAGNEVEIEAENEATLGSASTSSTSEAGSGSLDSVPSV